MHGPCHSQRSRIPRESRKINGSRASTDSRNLTDLQISESSFPYFVRNPVPFPNKGFRPITAAPDGGGSSGRPLEMLDRPFAAALARPTTDDPMVPAEPEATWRLWRRIPQRRWPLEADGPWQSMTNGGFDRMMIPPVQPNPGPVLVQSFVATTRGRPLPNAPTRLPETDSSRGRLGPQTGRKVSRHLLRTDRCVFIFDFGIVTRIDGLDNCIVVVRPLNRDCHQHRGLLTIFIGSHDYRALRCR